MNILERYLYGRKRTASIFDSLLPGYELQRPIPLRHPFLFYYGHIPTFSFLTLNRRILGEAALNESLERFFARGIDLAPGSDVQQEPMEWPTREQIDHLVTALDCRVIDALRNDNERLLPEMESLAIGTLLEHELEHHETLIYIINALDHASKRVSQCEQRSSSRIINGMQYVPAGAAHLGNSESQEFGWDNEFPQHTVHCNDFWMQRYAVSNGDWLAFVAQGGPVPHFWERKGQSWMLRCTYESIPLPLSWPVYVTQYQAASYAAFYAMRLPTEAEFTRAAYGEAKKRRFPWGNDAPSVAHANLGFRRFDPEGVDAHPLSASEFGIEGLVGNGWEWTSSPFEPFDGFTPMPTYPQYSADFFDGEHFVCKGASPATDLALVRPSFRNWFYGDYPYAYIKFRCVAS